MTNTHFAANRLKGFQLNPHSLRLYNAMAEFRSRPCVAFCVWCCDRLAPLYEGFSLSLGRKDHERFYDGLARLWTHVIGFPLSGDEKSRWIEFYQTAAGSAEDEASKPGWSDAANALAIFWYALNACSEDQQATWAVCAAETAREPLFQSLLREVITTKSIVPRLFSLEEHKNIREDPRMQALYRWEVDAAAYLQTHADLDEGDRWISL